MNYSSEDTGAPQGVRLNKALADAGVAARRKAEDLIRAGRVSVNGEVETDLSRRIEPSSDQLAVDGIVVTRSERLVYLMLNKPTGYLTAVSDQRERTVMELLPDGFGRLFPVGRLDRDTEGLLLVSNDGDLGHRLMHPRFHVRKTYRAVVDGRMTEPLAEKLRHGVTLDDGPTQPAEVMLTRVGLTSEVSLTIREGRKRQVRRMLSNVGHPVLELERVSYGPLTLGELPRGKWRELTGEELAALKTESEGTESPIEERTR
jgi:23S rRNA pseudouridine2605 synthase